MSDPETDASFLLYGAYGYTGRLVAEAAVERGFEPILAGRDPERVESVASEFGLPHRTFDVREASAFVDDVDAVLNCAGPFEKTADPMVDACIDEGTHYLDITGELSVFERIKRRSDEAEAAGVTLLPGVGFDVVPTDCLAAHLKRRLPEATHLALGLDPSGTVSRGTMKTVLSGIGDGGAVREDGVLRWVPVGHKTRAIDFGEGLKRAVTIPWGDVSTAHASTGIPNVEVYAAVPSEGRRLLAATKYLGGVLDAAPVQYLLRRLVDRYVEGPDERTREEGYALVWGEARSPGNRLVSRLRTPETYRLTVEASLLCTEKVLAGEAPTGYQTPSSAFGPDLILEIPGTERVDLDGDEVVERVSGPDADGEAAEARTT
ncbi:saccharopine dehydrogenase family protein [Halopelagius fulvigenes]|uniref:Saccharopine dehydrogenase family protein n=1 Tax=Halopelagius fulvigenes TaxID=1198324 RepID=A0ABD5U0A3_9EURY